MNPKLVLDAIHNWFRISVLWQQGQSFGLWAMQCMFLFTYFQWFSCMLLKFNFCAWLLPFNCCHFDMWLCRICGIKCWLPWWWWDKHSLFCWHCMGWRGISKAVAWHAPRVWPLWWCSYFWAKSSIPVLCWLPWWKWDMRTVFHLHCMGQHWYI